MYIDSLVSINIFNKNDNKVLNQIPILYYWNGEGDLLQNIFSDKSFVKKYFNNINYYNYSNLQIGYFYFKYDEDDNEQYIDNIKNIYECLNLNQFDSIHIVYEILIKYLFELYSVSMKTKYEDTKVYNQEIILDIYKQIINKYKDKFDKTSFINWIRNKILMNEILNNENVNYIISKLENILNNYE